MASFQLDYCLFSLNSSFSVFESAGDLLLPLKFACDIQTDTAVLHRFTFYPVYSAVWTFQP